MEVPRNRTLRSTESVPQGLQACDELLLGKLAHGGRLEAPAECQLAWRERGQGDGNTKAGERAFTRWLTALTRARETLRPSLDPTFHNEPCLHFSCNNCHAGRFNKMRSSDILVVQ